MDEYTSSTGACEKALSALLVLWDFQQDFLRKLKGPFGLLVNTAVFIVDLV
jgi:hypothetical protein